VPWLGAVVRWIVLARFRPFVDGCAFARASPFCELQMGPFYGHPMSPYANSPLPYGAVNAAAFTPAVLGSIPGMGMPVGRHAQQPEGA